MASVAETLTETLRCLLEQTIVKIVWNPPISTVFYSDFSKALLSGSIVRSC